MPAHQHPRNILGDAQMFAQAQKDDLEAIVADLRGLEEAFDHAFHHIMRRAAGANQKRREVIRQMREAQEAVDRLDAWRVSNPELTVAAL